MTLTHVYVVGSNPTARAINHFIGDCVMEDVVRRHDISAYFDTLLAGNDLHGDIRQFAEAIRNDLMDISVLPPAAYREFTGLKDKNGKEIHCGDILLFHFDDIFPEDYTLCEVCWYNNGWALRQLPDDAAGSTGFYKSLLPDHIDFGDCEEGVIVGSIQEGVSRELLF